ncbi:MAG TPA: crossover junction endodeoxyribonuclease RuvC, partial [Hyphomonas sp.]|nr:crossover junction endodeoxyribonuclease RuvC [Hyphomonas sp.]
MTATIRILGIDPGLRHTGWGVIEQTGARLAHIAHGVISVDTSLAMSERLGGIFEAVGELARHYGPHASGVEETLVNANPRSALKLGQARGAAMAALSMAGIPVAEFAPRKIKLAIVGT